MDFKVIHRQKSGNIAAVNGGGGSSIPATVAPNVLWQESEEENTIEPIDATTLDKIQKIKLGNAEISYDSETDSVKINKGLYSEDFISAYGFNSGGITEIDATDIIINTEGSGNAITDISADGHTITATKSNIDADVTAQKITTALGYTPFDNANFTKANIKQTLNIKDWALEANKPSYKFEDITDTPTTASGYGITDAITTANIGSQTVSRANQLTNTKTIWGQNFNGTQKVSGNMSGVGTIAASGDNVITKATEVATRFKVKNPNGAVSLLIHSNRGVYDDTNSVWLIGTNGTNTFLSDGNVGIGTTTPSEKLHVNGTAKVDTLKLGNATFTYDSDNDCIKVDKGFASEDFISAYGVNSSASGGGGGIADIVVNTEGNGNAITSISANGGTITANKGATYLTSISKQMVEGVLVGDISTHTHSQYYSSATSRTKNTVLAAPSTANGAATFRALVAADIPSLTKSKISDFPTSMPASDVSAWAKASTKPTYNLDEVLDGTTRKLANYLPLAGGTMTGKITLKANQYHYESVCGIDCNNSDIVGVNSIVTRDLSDSFSEGIKFYRDGSNWDIFTVKNGVAYFGANIAASGVAFADDNKFFSDLSNDGNNISISVGGTTRTLTPAYATSAGSAAKLTTARNINGTSFDGSAAITTANWGTARNISIADSDSTNTGTAVSVNGSAAVTLKLPSTIKATLSGNASSATKLATARTIWGQSFNGTANISGNLTGVGSISATGNHTISNTNNSLAFRLTGSAYDFGLHLGSGGTNRGIWEWSPANKWLLYFDSSNTILNYGNIGIGTTSPTSKLHCVGQGYFSSGVKVETDANSACNTKGIVIGSRGRIGANSSGALGIYSVGGVVIRPNCGTDFSNTSVGIQLDTAGTLTNSGEITAYSDIRKKDKIEDITLPLETISNAPLFKFKWNDREDDKPHIGTAAQYWLDKCPTLVSGDENTAYSLNYGVLGVSMGISLAKEIESLREENKQLKSELNDIKELIKQLMNK